MDAVRESMPPELINRLDEIVLFRPLSEAAIAEIAQLEIDRLRGRLTERGYVVEIAPAVVALVAQNGYDPAFGARHLQRNIERLLLEPLAGVAERELVADVADGKVVWRPAA
jgi:ATP-dependent Clp protease ATP-binding subunit ClpA